MNTTAALTYVSCGLRVRSDIPLSLPTSDDGVADVVVQWGPDVADTSAQPPGEVLVSYGSGETAWYTGTSTESGYILRFRNVGDFLVSTDHSLVTVRQDLTGRTDLIPILLAGTVLAFLLTLRGTTILHASAVAVDNSAIAFVGQSGRGKSTLAALLCADGARLVTDDVLAVDPGPPVTCVGGATEVRLREAAAAIARSRADCTSRLTADDRIALSSISAPLRPLPLTAIVVPTPSTTAANVVVRPASPTQGLFALLTFPRVFGWSRPEVLNRDFTVLGQVVNLVPVFDVTIPWGPPFDATIARTIADLAVPGNESVGRSIEG